MVKNRDDLGVFKGSNSLDLLGESGFHPIGRKSFWDLQEFQRDSLVEFRMEGRPNGSHAASSDGFDEPEWAETVFGVFHHSRPLAGQRLTANRGGGKLSTPPIEKVSIKR